MCVSKANFEASKSTPTLVWGSMRKRKPTWCGGVFHGEEGFNEDQELEEGFRAVEDMGTFADQSHRMAKDTKDGWKRDSH